MAESAAPQHTNLRPLLLFLNALTILLSLIGASAVFFVAIGFLVPFFIFNLIVFYCETKGIILIRATSSTRRGYERIDTPTTEADEAATGNTTNNTVADDEESTAKVKMLIVLLDMVVVICCIVFHFVVGIIASDRWGGSSMFMGYDVAYLFVICA